MSWIYTAIVPRTIPESPMPAGNERSPGGRSERIDALASRLAPHYSRFRVSERLLFTGHSHQAWPDVAEQGLLEAFAAAADKVDDKWPPAMDRAERLRAYLRHWYNDSGGHYGLASSTHQLLVSWLSALDLAGKPHIVTTDGEFHSMHRQLQRLVEAGVRVRFVPVEPLDSLGERILLACEASTSAVMLSRVFFETSLINPHLEAVGLALRDRRIPMLVDDYHGTNVVPLSLASPGLANAYLVTGGYKYLQWGEGNCFLRYPRDCALRPVVTGWYSSFSSMQEPRHAGPSRFDEGEWRFASATYDPVSQYRAARVVGFFESQQLDASVLRDQSQRQTAMLRDEVLAADLDPALLSLAHPREPVANGGFLALKSPQAAALCEALADRGVRTDVRGNILRLGPAPYTSSAQIKAAISELRRCVLAL